jgi:hypothetical protein
MATTYTPIATNTLGSATATVTFSSIASTYTDLVLIISSAITTGAGSNVFTFNTDTGNNYSFTAMEGDGTTIYSTRSASRGNISVYDELTTTLGGNVSIVNIMNYSNATTYKTTISRGSNASVGVSETVGLWRSTAAINQIVITNNASTTFKAGSTFTLYGIKAA